MHCSIKNFIIPVILLLLLVFQTAILKTLPINQKSTNEINRAEGDYLIGSDSNFGDKTRVFPLYWWVNLLGIAIAITFVVAWTCCVKKRSGSYGATNRLESVQIYRLKPAKPESEIPGLPETKSSTITKTASTVTKTVPVVIPKNLNPEKEPTKLARYSPTPLKTDVSPATSKRIVKEDISPPIIEETNATATVKKFKSNLAFSNPDPASEPLKPFTYSPIPPVRPGRTKGTANILENRKSPSTGVTGEPDAPAKGTHLPFSNPDPTREPLKPFTYSPIPVRPEIENPDA